MKKIYVLAVVLLACFSMVIIDAKTAPVATIVDGTVYQGNIDNGVSGVLVGVMCNGNVLNTTTGSNGEYLVDFTPDKCSCGDDVFVSVYEGGAVIGYKEGNITLCAVSVGSITLDVGIVNVPLVPEFGFVIGMLTILGGVGIFFVVRKD